MDPTIDNIDVNDRLEFGQISSISSSGSQLNDLGLLLVSSMKSNPSYRMVTGDTGTERTYKGIPTPTPLSSILASLYPWRAHIQTVQGESSGDVGDPNASHA